ncbi:MAG: hypothetical protein U0230_05160 [Polyangiales bacterium]
MNHGNFWGRMWADGSIASALAGLALTVAVSAAKTAFVDDDED